MHCAAIIWDRKIEKTAKWCVSPWAFTHLKQFKLKFTFVAYLPDRPSDHQFILHTVILYFNQFCMNLLPYCQGRCESESESVESVRMRWIDKKKVKNKIEKCETMWCVVIYVTLIERSRPVNNIEHIRICFPHPNLYQSRISWMILNTYV